MSYITKVPDEIRLTHIVVISLIFVVTQWIIHIESHVSNSVGCACGHMHSVNIPLQTTGKVNILQCAEVNVSSWACSWQEGAKPQGEGWVWGLHWGCFVPHPAPTHPGGVAVSLALRSPQWVEQHTSAICGQTPTWRGSAEAEGIRPDTASNGCKIFPGARCRWHQRYTGL